MAERSVEATAERLGRDAAAYRRLMEPLVRRWDDLGAMILGPLLRVPRHPVLLARFGLPALLPATRLARTLFHDDRTHALFAGMAAHSMLPLDGWISASFGLVLSTLAHAVGWPMVLGGTQALADALAAYLRALGGEIRTGHTVRTLDELPPSRAVLLDLTPRQVLQIAGDRLPAGYRQALNRYRYGPGVFKIDFALSSPIPWQTPDTARAATVHLGGTLPEIAAAERAVWQGKHPERPYVIVVQQSLFDPTRAPAGQHTAWAYCHVPNGSTCDLSGVIEAQIERAAPGFRDTVLARHTLSPAAFEAYNANYVGGDINGGVQDLAQLVMRPTLRLNPYTTPVRGLYLCSSSTPPGGGVHGMSGHLAARTALRRMF